MSVEGDLREFSLISVMQIICMEHRRTGLHVRRRGEEAVVLFDGGDIVFAALGGLKGEEAVYQLLTWTEGSFRTTDQVPVNSRNVWKNWNHLLIEGMKRIDEQKRDNHVQNGAPLSRQDAERDSRLENDLILLLSSLEQGMARLADKKLQKRPAAVLELLADLVNQVADFAEHLEGAAPSAFALRAVVNQAAGAHPSVRSLRLVGNRLSNDSGSNSGNGWRNMFGSRQPGFRETCSGMLVVLESYFAGFASLFLSPSIRDQWKETYGVFIVDLKMNLSKVQL